MKQRFLVIGLGRFGGSLAKWIHRYGGEIIAIDHSSSVVESLKNDIPLVIQANAEDLEVLKQVGADKVDVAIVCTGDSLETSVIAVSHLVDLGLKRVLAKANTPMAARILQKIGAHDVIFVETEMGKQMAYNLVKLDIYRDLEISGFKIKLWKPQDRFTGKSIKDLALPSRYRVQIIAIKNKSSTESLHFPTANDLVTSDSHLVIVGRNEDVDKLLQD